MSHLLVFWVIVTVKLFLPEGHNTDFSFDVAFLYGLPVSAMLSLRGAGETLDLEVHRGALAPYEEFAGPVVLRYLEEPGLAVGEEGYPAIGFLCLIYPVHFLFFV